MRLSDSTLPVSYHQADEPLSRTCSGHEQSELTHSAYLLAARHLEPEATPHRPRTNAILELREHSVCCEPGGRLPTRPPSALMVA